MTVSHWAVDDDELEQPAEFEVLGESKHPVSSLCKIDYYSGELESQVFTLSFLQDGLEEYVELVGDLDYVVVKFIESYNVTEDKMDSLLVLTDESNSTAGVIIAPRRDEHVKFTDDYTTLSEKTNGKKN